MKKTVKRVRIYPVEERLHCAECGTELERLPQVLTSKPPQYQYRCGGWCDDAVEKRIHRSEEAYPRVRYEKLEGEDE